MTFQESYLKYSKLVFNLALQYVQNTQDAEEITQDVFVVIHQSLSTFQQKSDIQTWVYRITINKSLDFLKAKKRQKRFAFITSLLFDDTNSLSTKDHNFDHPGAILEQSEAIENIFNHINSLSDNQKTVLILSKIEQKSQKEVAEIMDLSTKAVESLLQRAKANLTQKLNQNKGK